MASSRRNPGCGSDDRRREKDAFLATMPMTMICPCGSDIEGGFGYQGERENRQSLRSNAEAKNGRGRRESTKFEKQHSKKEQQRQKIIPPAYRWTFLFFGIQAAYSIRMEEGKCKLVTVVWTAAMPGAEIHTSKRPVTCTRRANFRDGFRLAGIHGEGGQRAEVWRVRGAGQQSVLMLSSEERFLFGKRTRTVYAAIMRITGVAAGFALQNCGGVDGDFLGSENLRARRPWDSPGKLPRDADGISTPLRTSTPGGSSHRSDLSRHRRRAGVSFRSLPSCAQSLMTTGFRRAGQVADHVLKD